MTKLMHPLHTGFGHWLNRVQNRLGPVFAQRFTSVLCDEEHTARLIAYIHNNPVRAGVVRDPADSPWTSHRAYIGEVRAPAWLDVVRGLSLCGFDSSPSGRLAFHEFVLSRSGDPRDPDLSDGSFARDRTRLRSLVGAPAEVSSPLLVSGDDGGMTRDLVAPAGTPLRPRWSGDPMAVLELVSEHTGVAIEQLQCRDRCRAVAGARRLALMVGVRLGIRQAVLSGLVGIAQGSASELLHGAAASRGRIIQLANELAAMCWESSEQSDRVFAAKTEEPKTVPS